MSDPDQELASKLKSDHDILSDVPLETITIQVRSLRNAGIDEERLETLIPKLFRLKDTVDEKMAENVPLNPREIRIDSLPDEFDRENWQ